MRDTSFSICKALAIICVVLSHAGGPSWLTSFVFQFHVPVFFICAGYFFKTKYADDEKTFIVRRIDSLYLPFLRWSIFFLLLHNLWFYTGVLNEQFGNAAGGVLHPYSWHDFSQRLWSIVFNMSGYDEFLCGAFWFFRALLLSSIGFLVGYKLSRRFIQHDDPKKIGWCIFFAAAFLSLWLILGGLKVTGVAQGGYRELLGITFMAIGFLYARYKDVFSLNWQVGVGSFAILVLLVLLCPSSMATRVNTSQAFVLPIAGTAGFFMLLSLSRAIDKYTTVLKRVLVYIGDRTLYIFAFHLLAFKVISILKVYHYNLPWNKIGGHPVVTDNAQTDMYFLLYLLAGIVLPLAWLAAYRYIMNRWGHGLGYARFLNIGWMTGAIRKLLSFSLFLLKSLVNGIIRTFQWVWQGIKSFFQGIKDVISASNPKDE